MSKPTEAVRFESVHNWQAFIAHHEPTAELTTTNEFVRAHLADRTLVGEFNQQTDVGWFYPEESNGQWPMAFKQEYHMAFLGAEGWSPTYEEKPFFYTADDFVAIVDRQGLSVFFEEDAENQAYYSNQTPLDKFEDAKKLVDELSKIPEAHFKVFVKATFKRVEF